MVKMSATEPVDSEKNRFHEMYESKLKSVKRFK